MDRSVAQRDYARHVQEEKSASRPLVFDDVREI
jgi:hypothetical protein